MTTDPVKVAAGAMYAARDAIPPKPAKNAPESAWDAYCAARTAYDEAEAAYHDAYRRKVSGYTGTIRKA